MDDAFDSAEAADQALMSDQALTGVFTGIVPVQEATPDLTVDVTAGTAYDVDGQRITLASTQNLDVSVDSNALSTAVVSGGNEKWVSVFVQFDRALSDPRVDGNGIPLQYLRTESYQFIVDQGSESAAGTAATLTSANAETYALADGQTLLVVVDRTSIQTATFNTGDFGAIGAATAAEVAAVIQADIAGVTAADVGGDVVITSEMTGASAEIEVVGGTAFDAFAFPVGPANGSGGPSRPALRADAILLADILLRFGTAAIYDAPGNGGATDGIIDLTSRRELPFVYSGSQFTLRAGTITEFADLLADELTNHLTGVGSTMVHPASALTFDNSSVPATWPDLGVATTVQAAIDAIHSDLASADATDGAAAIGFDNTGTSPDITAADVAAVLVELDSNKGSRSQNNTGADAWTGINYFQNDVRVEDATFTVYADTDVSNHAVEFLELQNFRSGAGTSISDNSKMQAFNFAYDALSVASGGTVALMTLPASTTYLIEVAAQLTLPDQSNTTGRMWVGHAVVTRDGTTGADIDLSNTVNQSLNSSAITLSLQVTSGVLELSYSNPGSNDIVIAGHCRVTRIANQLV